ncbi:hypothetical protein VPH35_059718 [Triticum aestivum]
MRAPWRWSRSCSRRRWTAATTALASMSSITSIAISVMQSQVLHFMILIVDGVRNFMARAMVYLRCVKGNIFVDPKITLYCCNFSVEKCLDYSKIGLPCYDDAKNGTICSISFKSETRNLRNSLDKY